MKFENTISKALDILKGFDEVAAVGLSGSSVSGKQDEMSDLDIAVFASWELPDPETRKARYATYGISDLAYFDVDFEVSRGDGLQIDDVDCSFIWMSLQKARAFLQALTEDFDCDEFLPGGLMTMQTLLDPDETIASLRDSVPSYPEIRARQRITRNLREAHYSIYVLAWLQKAAIRNDYFSFLKNEYEVMDRFFTALFALNHQWFSHEKRLTEIVSGFEVVPRDVGYRIKSIIMHKNSCEDLSRCQQEIKRLFADLAAISQEKYPGLNVPRDWK
jgi:predicted nucleotidyltransferase